jgi:hypothetical protein
MMLKRDFIQIKAALADWVHIDKWQYPLSTTLTCRKALPDPLGYLRPVTEQDCHQNLRHVMRIMNQSFLGSARSKKERIPIFPVLESSADGRFHYHAIIDVPEGVDARFVQKLECAWRTSRVGYREMDFQIAYNQGWVEYILKDRSKAHYLDAIDLGNLELPTARRLKARGGCKYEYPQWYVHDPIKQWIELVQAFKRAKADLKEVSGRTNEDSTIGKAAGA